MAERTPSQTVGPFFHEALRWPDGGRVGFAGAGGTAVVLTGRVVDGGGEPVGDAMIESWQRGPDNEWPSGEGAGKPHGFARVETARDGTFRIETRLPGGERPCLEIAIFARGLLKALRTRVYLAPESDVRKDPALQPLAASPRLATLVARARGSGEYHWDVRLQGDGETVFFAA